MFRQRPSEQRGIKHAGNRDQLTGWMPLKGTEEEQGRGKERNRDNKRVTVFPLFTALLPEKSF